MCFLEKKKKIVKKIEIGAWLKSTQNDICFFVFWVGKNVGKVWGKLILNGEKIIVEKMGKNLKKLLIKIMEKNVEKIFKIKKKRRKNERKMIRKEKGKRKKKEKQNRFLFFLFLS
ncbi:hypothetical protein RFI_25943 [Reticulomyxa filosa]|uniref:Uncharacterized protein n=1 Tax=Reticulomyxa filosa TaxID=46433 RepID=X6MBQ9_RETFI|nr:hypothetical protein RFI_25943 [Reticulomyxa filosa]|eukprot:ETO11433.1 hypothetical protein RFI_25943 [Reticulomyxa filosa]